jgi:hypothetical protein
VYVYNREEKKSEHQTNLHIDGKSDPEASSAQCNKMLHSGIKQPNIIEARLVSLSYVA